MSNRVRSIKFFTGAQARIMMRLKRPDGEPFTVDGATITAVLLARDGDLISTVTPVSDAAVGADWAAGEVVVAFYTAEGDAISLSAGIMVHVHTTSRFIKWMIENPEKIAAFIELIISLFPKES